MSTQPYAEGGRGPTSSSNPLSAGSLLVADCGTVFTKVSLFGLVEGQYRLMARGEAPTTIAPPYEDITKGIIQAINVIEFITGRHFISEEKIISPEQPNGDGQPIQCRPCGGVSGGLEEQRHGSGLWRKAGGVDVPAA